MHQNDKLTIYFGDLVHNFLGAGSYMFPLNIGFISAYAKKRYGDLLHIELFKYPDELIAAIRARPPDILSLSNYTWNSHLNGEVAGFARSIRSDTLIVFGGPDINLNERGYRNFFATHPDADLYVLCEGEEAFAGVINRYLAAGRSRSQAKQEPLDGCVICDNGTLRGGRLLDRIEDVNTIPSPYLTGMLDKFFDYKLIPIIETNRGCPFSCIFCAQGLMSHHKVKYFDLERVYAELDYIAGKVHHTNILCLADANFGIHVRDTDIGERIKKLSDTRGYPRSCSINWVKTRNAIKVAERMGQSEYLVSSLQSLDPEVLKIIKRHNVETSLFKEIIEHVNRKGGVSGTEIILGLPGETKASHAHYLRELFNWGVSYIICYNCLLINGSELTLPEYREKYRIASKFRLLDSAWGKYGPVVSFEYEEGVRSTSTMSEEDILYFRPIHWLIQFLWNYHTHFPLLKYCFNKGINPYDLIVAILGRIDSAPEPVRRIFADFRAEAKNEWFDSPQALREHYTKNFDVLEGGSVGKMNSKYIWRVVLECRKDFDAYVAQVAASMLPSEKEVIAELVRYSSTSLLDFSSSDKTGEETTATFTYDVRDWQQQGFTGDPARSRVSYRFTLTPEKKHALDVLFDQYRHENINVTLRKMSEHIKFDDLYYTVTKA